MYELCRLRRSEGYEVCAGEVRVETCGKSARIGVEASVAVNSIRSNTVEETHGLPDRLRGGGLSVPATVRRDRWLSITEPGLQFRS